MNEWKRYFMSGRQMRHAKWQESVMHSVIKRRGNKKATIDHYMCCCGCGTVAFINNHEPPKEFNYAHAVKIFGFKNKNYNPEKDNYRDYFGYDAKGGSYTKVNN